MSTAAEDDRTPRPVSRFSWEAIIRRAELDRDLKYTALMLATFGDPDGTRVRPGELEMAASTGDGQSTVRRRVKELRELGLLIVVSRGGGRNGTGKHTEYRLTIPVDLLERVEVRPPGGAARKAQRAVLATVSPLAQGSAQSDDSPLAQASAQSGPSPVDNSESPLAIESGQSPVDNPNDRSDNAVSDGMTARKTPMSARSAERLPDQPLKETTELGPDPTQPTTAREHIDPPEFAPAGLKPPRCPHGLRAHLRNGQPACPLCRRAATNPDPPP